MMMMLMMLMMDDDDDDDYDISRTLLSLTLLVKARKAESKVLVVDRRIADFGQTLCSARNNSSLHDDRRTA